MQSIKLNRSGNSPLVFEGELIGESSSEIVHGQKQNRWHDIQVYRTADSRFVVHVGFCSQWIGEIAENNIEVVTEPAKVATVLRAYDPCQFMQVHDDPKGNISKQAVSRRYMKAVGEVLKSSDEFVETLASSSGQINP